MPQVGGNAAQRREHDKRHGAGTMSRSGAQCPCCPTIMSMEDIRYEGRAGRLGAVMTAVVVGGVKGKEYRLPTNEELRAAEVSKEELDELYEQIPFGLPEEPTPRQGPGAARAFSRGQLRTRPMGESCLHRDNSFHLGRSRLSCVIYRPARVRVLFQNLGLKFCSPVYHARWNVLLIAAAK